MTSFAPLAPMAAPAAPPPARPPVAPPAQLPLTPSRHAPVADNSPEDRRILPGEIGFPIHRDSLAPLAPEAVTTQGECCGDGGGGEREPVEPGGRNESIQVNDHGHFAGYDRLIYSENNQALLLEGNLYLTAPFGGQFSSTNGALTIHGANGLNMSSASSALLTAAGSITMTAGSLFQINMTASGVFTIFGSSIRQTGVTYNNMNLIMFGGVFRIEHFSSGTQYFTVNANPTGGRSPITMRGLPRNVVGLQPGDLWTDGQYVMIWDGGTEAASTPRSRNPPAKRKSGRLRSAMLWISTIPGTVSHWLGGLVDYYSFIGGLK